MFLPGRYVVFRKNGLGRAFRLTQGAIDAFDRIDDQEIRALVEAIHRTDFHAVGIFAADAVFNDDKWHKSPTSG
jgi:hypothetical protein